MISDIEGPSADELPHFLDRIEAVFGRFGWAVTDEFKDQYVHVSTVYHLTNGLVLLAEENEAPGVEDDKQAPARRSTTT